MHNAGMEYSYAKQQNIQIHREPIIIKQITEIFFKRIYWHYNVALLYHAWG